MRAFFQNRRRAVWCFAAVAVLFSLLGINRSVGRQSRLVREMFDSGVYIREEGYTAPSLRSHLEVCVDDAMGLLTVLNRYDGLSEAAEQLRQARQALLDAMNADDVPGMAAANDALKAALTETESGLARTVVLERDAAALEDYLSGLRGAQTAIAANPYNDRVEDFRRYVLGAVPTVFLRPLLFCPLPEAFAAE